MRYLLYLQNSKHFTPNNISYLRSMLDKESLEPEIEKPAIRNIRISDEEVQLDLFLFRNNREIEDETAHRIAARFENEIGSLNKIINLSDGLTTGLNEVTIIRNVIKSFNEKRYWESQETAEAIWNKTTNPDERDVIQGVILAGAALVHHQRNEDEVCISILGRSLAKLQAFNRVSRNRRCFIPIDIESLRNDIQAILSDGKVKDMNLKYITS